MEGNPYESLWDEISEESEQPDEQDVRWGLAVPKGWRHERAQAQARRHR